MALNDDQIATAWERLISAETYALYFGSLASRYSSRQRYVTFVSFFFSSAAAVTVSKFSMWLPIAFSLIVALATAYSIAIGLESKTRTMAKLHESWHKLGQEYTELWNRTWSDEAEAVLYALMRREQELSTLATTEAPNNRKLMAESEEQIFRMHHLAV